MAYTNWWGKEVPSVTQVLSILAKPALVRWAWSLGMEGKDYREVRDERMNVGTLVHKRIR